MKKNCCWVNYKWVIIQKNNNKLVNVPTGLNKLKTKVDGLDADKLKTVPVDLKWCSE